MSIEPPERPEADRSPSAGLGWRLTVFGIAAIAVGAGFGVLGLLQLLVAFVGPVLDAASAVAGAMLYALIGIVLVTSGIGSLRRRRWVRPVMLLVSGTWILVGVVAVWLVRRLLPEMLLLGGLPPESPEAAVVRTVATSVAAAFGVVLPAAFFWAYRDPRVALACARHDTRPGFGDRLPPEALTLSAALAGAALLSLPMLVRPVVPLFGHLATGWPGRLLLAAGIAGCAWLAWSTFRLRATGYWATLVLLVLLGVSTVWTFARVDPLEVYRGLGYPQELLDAMPSIGTLTRSVTQLGAVVLTIGGAVWMLRIRRHFT